MGRLSKMAGLAALVAALMMAGGCGDGSSGPNPSVTSPVAANINPDGTATTGANAVTVAAPPGTQGYLAAVSATLSPNTRITAHNADGSAKMLAAPPSFTFTAPADSSAVASGTYGVPAPAGLGPLVSASGAVDVQLTDAASATFDPPLTVTMPVPGKAAGAVIDVYTVTGATYSFLGSFTVTSAGLVSFPVSRLSWKVGDPNPKPGLSTTAETTVATTIETTTTVAPTTTTTAATTTIPTTTTTTAATTTVPPTTVATTTIPPTTTIATTTTTTVPPTTTTVLPTTTTTIAPTLDGAALYAANCQICHGPLLTPAAGRKIPNTTTVAIIRSLGMAFGLTDAELLAIIAVLPP